MSPTATVLLRVIIYKLYESVKDPFHSPSVVGRATSGTGKMKYQSTIGAKNRVKGKNP